MSRPVLVILFLLICGGLPLACLEKDSTTMPPQKMLRQIQLAMQSRKYSQAITLASAALQNPKTDHDYFGYLKALAQFYGKSYSESEKTLQPLLAAKSEWRRKARFLLGRIYLQRKDYARLVKIYADEAQSLHTAARKEKIANIYIAFAKELARQPGAEELQAPQPDYFKALTLYEKALELKPGDKLSEELAFRLGEIMCQAENWSRAEIFLKQYLQQYDPDWQELRGAQSTVKSKATLTGEHRWQARYLLGQAMAQSHKQVLAREIFEDLIALLSTSAKADAKKLHHDALWQLTRCYHATNSYQELNGVTTALRRYLRRFPQGRYSVQAAYEIGANYLACHRSVEAVAALKEFLAGTGYQVASKLPSGDGKETPAQMHARLRQQATYELGQLYAGQRLYPQAISVWQQYIAQFPNGTHWATAQQGILDAEYQIGEDLLAAQRYQETRTVWQRFLAKYPLDQRARRILYVFGQINYQMAVDAEKAGKNTAKSLFAQAVTEWQKLIAKYSQSDEAQAARFICAQTYEQHLGDLKQALATYRQIDRSKWQTLAQTHISRMTRKHLEVHTPRIYRSDEEPSVRVTTRNIKKLTLRTYRLDLEEYFRKEHRIRGVEQLDIGLIEPDTTHEIKVSGYADYLPIQRQIKIAMDGPGVYAVNISGDDFEATTMVVRSDLDIIIKSSRREVLVFAQNMRSGKPAANARVLVSNGSKVVAQGSTNDQGVWRQKLPELKDYPKVSVFVVNGKNIASNLLSLSGLQFSHGLAAKGYIFTDRPAYRPGEEINIRAIIREVADGIYIVPAPDSYRLSLFDAQGRMLLQEKVKLSEFGTAHKSFTLAAQAPVGQYRIDLVRQDGKHRFSGEFQVAYLRLAKVQLRLTFPQRVYFRGEKIVATFQAGYYYGTALAHKELRYTLPDGRSYLGKTDSQGRLQISFVTDRMRPGTKLKFRGRLESEGVEVREQVFLARYGFSLRLSTSRPVILAGEPVEVTMTTRDAATKAIGKKIAITVYRKVAVKTDPVLAALPWKEKLRHSHSEIKVATATATTDASSGIARVSFTLKQGGNYILRASGNDRFGNVVEGDTRLFVSGNQDQTRLRIFSERQHLKVGQKLQTRIHSRLQKALALVTFEGEEILDYQVLTLNAGDNILPLTVAHRHFPNFQMSVAVMAGNHFYQAHQAFTVERQMQITVKSQKKSYAPGSKAKIEISASDHLGQPVRAEISLAMIDAALFATYPDQRLPIVEFFQKGAQRVAALRSESSCTFHYHGRGTKVKQALRDENRRRELLAARRRAMLQRQSSGERTNFDERSQLFRRARRGSFTLGQTANRSESQHRNQLRDDYRVMAQLPGGVRLPAVNRPPAAPTPPRHPRHEVAAVGWWSPVIVTGNDGKASVEVTMPEKIGKWRLTGIGCTPQTLVGESKSSLITNKEFFVDVKLPGFFLEGDQARILTRVHNLTDYHGPARLLLEVAMDDDRVVQPQQIQISARRTNEFVFDPVVIRPCRQCRITVTAIIDAKKLQDAVQQELWVRPWGMEYVGHSGGKADTSTTAFVELPPQRYHRRWMTVVIGPTVPRTLIDLALGPKKFSGWLRPAAYGASADASELVAAVAVGQYVAQVGNLPGDYQQLQARSHELVAGLVMAQKDSGGWGMAAGTHVDIAVSARVLWALALAQQAGVSVAGTTITKAVSYLQTAFTQISHRDNETKALVQYALALVHKSDFAYGNRLYRQRASMASAGLCYTALLLHQLGKNEMAVEVLDLLQQRRQHLARSNQAPWSTTGNVSWSGNTIETTALAVIALMTVRPASPDIKVGIDYLLAAKRGSEYYPHHSKGMAVLALAGYFAQARHHHNDYHLTVMVNDQRVGEIHGQATAPTAVIQVPDRLVRSGRNRVNFELRGNGTYTYSVSLRGFAPAIRDPKSWRYPYIYGRTYRHAPLEYDGRSIEVTSSSTVGNLELGQITPVEIHINSHYDKLHSKYLVVEESLPAGAIVVRDSIRGSFAYYQFGRDRIFFYFDPSHYLSTIHYSLAGYAPGRYRVLPTIIRDLHHPERMRFGKVGTIAVLAPGERSPDVYRMNNSELYQLGRRHFDDGHYRQALKLLTKLYAKQPTYNQREVARMLLWIYTEQGYYHAQKIVDYFEILKEKYPELYIPFGRILTVGQAYRDIQEYERAYLVFAATIEASFAEEAKVGGILEDQGEFLGAIDYMRSLWKDYHDSATVAQAYFGLSQALYAKINKIEQLKHNIRLYQRADKRKTPSKQELLVETIALLREFLCFYPQSPQADDACFSLASAFLDLDCFTDVVRVSRQSRQRYSDSKFVSSFQYMEALGLFSQGHYDQAIHQAKEVADGDSKDKDYATYILGQIYHARGNPDEAITSYRRVSAKFPDAAEAIAYFQRRYIRLPEVTRLLPGENVAVELEYCNIKEAQFLIYRVDLMKLYLQQKNLSGITKVHLAGIVPVMEKRLALGIGKDYQSVKRKIALALQGEGAYLVICRGDDLFASGLILVTPLRIDVQEDTTGQRVRVNIVEKTTNKRPKGVHVKVIGTASGKFVSGETDLRGIFVADAIRGKVTVIARERKNRYAFYRGDNWLGDEQRPVLQKQPTPQTDSQYNFRSNLQLFNKKMQMMNTKKLYRQMRYRKQGVQVEQAK